MDFLSVTDLGHDGLAEVLATAAAVKAEPARVAGRLAGRKVGLFFEKPSTRTRVSCEVATVDLGAAPVVLKQDEVGLGKRESVADVARTLDRYLDVLAFRVFRHGDLVTVAEYAAAPVINLLSDPKSVTASLVGIAIMASLLLLSNGRWIASLAAAVVSVGFNELGFMTWPLALVVLLWAKHPSSPFPHQRGEGEGLGGRGYRLPTAAWLIALGLMLLIHFLAVGHGYIGGSNRAWFWRATVFFGGPAVVDLVTGNVIRVFVSVLLFANLIIFRRMSILIRFAGILVSFGLGVLLDAHLQEVSPEVSIVRLLTYGLELRTILICLFWLFVAREARHDWQTVAFGSALCFVAALPVWTVTQKSDYTLYVATFFMEIAVAAALCSAAASLWAYAAHKERR